MRNLPYILFSAQLLLASVTLADFLPENDLWKDDNLHRKTSITEEDFNSIIDEVEKPYLPIFQALGAELRIFRLWTDPTVNAGSAQASNFWKIWLWGGLARRPEMTPDAYALVLCHEIGHHLGGYPFSKTAWGSDMSAEGQADYYSTQVCPRVIWKGQNAKNAASGDKLDPIPKTQCDRTWQTQADRNLCYRVMKASEALAAVDATLSDTAISWATPDLTQVETTNLSYPSGQCRLDTYAAGAACDKSWNHQIIPAKNLADRDSEEAEALSTVATCSQSDPFGHRPRCWFKPYLD